MLRGHWCNSVKRKPRQTNKGDGLRCRSCSIQYRNTDTLWCESSENIWNVRCGQALMQLAGRRKKTKKMWLRQWSPKSFITLSNISSIIAPNIWIRAYWMLENVHVPVHSSVTLWFSHLLMTPALLFPPSIFICALFTHGGMYKHLAAHFVFLFTHTKKVLLHS